MTRKSLKFIAGYVVFGIEEKVRDYLENNTGDRMTVGCDVSKCMFTDSLDYVKYVPTHKMNKVHSLCCDALGEVFTKYNISGSWDSSVDHIHFNFFLEKKDMPKCMTKEEIEKALGHKITIIDRR